MTQFPSGTSVVYAVFDYSQASNSGVRVRVFNAFGTAIFDLSRTYNGSGTDSIPITGTLGDGQYLTVVYVYLRGNYSPAASAEWTIGQDTSATPTLTLPTTTSTPTASLTTTPSTTPTHTGTPTATRTRSRELYLPLIRRNPAVIPTPTPIPTPAVCDGGFEAGQLEPCWQPGGELAQQVVDRLDTDEPAFAGHYSAALGQPELGDGIGGNIPAGSAWIQQRIRVPDIPQPRLTFQLELPVTPTSTPTPTITATLDFTPTITPPIRTPTLTSTLTPADTPTLTPTPTPTTTATHTDVHLNTHVYGDTREPFESCT